MGQICSSIFLEAEGAHRGSTLLRSTLLAVASKAASEQAAAAAVHHDQLDSTQPGGPGQSRWLQLESGSGH